MLRDSRGQSDLFISGDIEQFIPDDHILRRVDRVLDLSWLRGEVSPLYSSTTGRPGIEPEAAVRLMLAGLFSGIVHDRKLLREAQVNLAIRWFCGYGLRDSLPHHSSLTRIRQRWGAELFHQIFQRIVADCVAAGLVNGEALHVDATLIRADVSWDSMVRQHVERVVEVNDAAGEGDSGTDRRPPAAGTTAARKSKKVSRTDPEASLTTNKHSFRMEPSYKAHTAVDSSSGVVVGMAVTTGQQSEGAHLPTVLEEVTQSLGRQPEVLTADKGYCHGRNFSELERRSVKAVISIQAERGKPVRLPQRRFTYDGRHKILTCPAGRKLGGGKQDRTGRRMYRGSAETCGSCHLSERCLSPKAKVRVVAITAHHEALTRARRRWARGWSSAEWKIYNRHRGLVEGVHGEAKSQHGLARAARRGLAEVSIQVWLTAAVINLKRLARPFWRAIWLYFREISQPAPTIALTNVI
jgi:transposase